MGLSDIENKSKEKKKEQEKKEEDARGQSPNHNASHGVRVKARRKR